MSVCLSWENIAPGVHFHVPARIYKCRMDSGAIVATRWTLNDAKDPCSPITSIGGPAGRESVTSPVELFLSSPRFVGD